MCPFISFHVIHVKEISYCEFFQENTWYSREFQSMAYARRPFKRRKLTRTPRRKTTRRRVGTRRTYKRRTYSKGNSHSQWLNSPDLIGRARVLNSTSRSKVPNIGKLLELLPSGLPPPPDKPFNKLKRDLPSGAIPIADSPGAWYKPGFNFGKEWKDQMSDTPGLTNGQVEIINGLGEDAGWAIGGLMATVMGGPLLDAALVAALSSARVLAGMEALAVRLGARSLARNINLLKNARSGVYNKLQAPRVSPSGLTPKSPGYMKFPSNAVDGFHYKSPEIIPRLVSAPKVRQVFGLGRPIDYRHTIAHPSKLRYNPPKTTFETISQRVNHSGRTLKQYSAREMNGPRLKQYSAREWNQGQDFNYKSYWADFGPLK